jgi:hypothetical protein
MNEKNTLNQEKLIDAAINGDFETIKRLFLEHDTDVNIKNSDGYTALRSAVNNNHIRIVEFLLKNGAEINAKNNNGKTALMIAVEKEYYDIIELITHYGAKEVQSVEKSSNFSQTLIGNYSMDRLRMLRAVQTILLNFFVFTWPMTYQSDDNSWALTVPSDDIFRFILINFRITIKTSEEVILSSVLIGFILSLCVTIKFKNLIKKKYLILSIILSGLGNNYVQLGGVNIAEKGHVQLGGGNIAAKGHFQAGALNFAGKLKGKQIGIINLAAEINGLQVGVVNVNFGSSGLKLGLFNLEARPKGLTVGLLNFASKLSGLQIGLLNINMKGPLPVMIGFNYGG